MYIYIHVYIHINRYIYTYIYINAYTYIYKCIYTYTYTYACICIHIHIHSHIYIYINIYVHTHIHIYIHNKYTQHFTYEAIRFRQHAQSQDGHPDPLYYPSPENTCPAHRLRDRHKAPALFLSDDILYICICIYIHDTHKNTHIHMEESCQKKELQKVPGPPFEVPSYGTCCIHVG